MSKGIQIGKGVIYVPKRKKHYRNFWHSAVIDMLKSYSELKESNSVQSILFTSAIEDGLKETLKLPDGELRVKAIKMRYFENPTKNVEIVADEIPAGPATISRWCNSFVRLVGKKAGF